jgi:hypothetical protein
VDAWITDVPAVGSVLLTASSGSDVPARAQMGATLGFHIILACIGIAMPTIVLMAEYVGLRHSHAVALLLARRWSQALGVLVAVGAVTGTVLSFEMGLLWPGLMRQYGSVLGLPFRVRGCLLPPGGPVLVPTSLRSIWCTKLPADRTAVSRHTSSAGRNWLGSPPVHCLW